MKVVLKELTPSPLFVGERASTDLFSGQGCLLLAKGQMITPKIYRLLQSQKVFSINYEIDSSKVTGQFSLQIYKQLVQSVEYFFTKAQLFDSEVLGQTLAYVELILKEIHKGKMAFELNQLRTFDNYTYVHSVNVAILSAMMGTELGLPDQSLRHLTLGALLHDIGKVNIPLEVLNKPQALTPSEFEFIQKHPQFALERFGKTRIPQRVKLGIFQHHERWGGQGYPNKLKKDEISLEGQIIALADVFDALTADRPYRKGIPPYHAFEMILSMSGLDFSPTVVEGFKLPFIAYSLNSLVRLDSGEAGVVIAVPRERPTRPLLRILFDKHGRYLDRVLELDLLKDSSRYITKIEFPKQSVLNI
jgi:putative nucleotidyltransferase with HDIG domain